MTIVFTGGGTGGHFYPIIAIAEAVNDAVRTRRLLAPRLYYLAPTPFDEQTLFENNLVFVRIPAGKMRRYRSFANIPGMFLTFVGVLAALMTLFRLFPDVVVSKGGYGSVPTTIAARLLGIPVIIHESDAKPGRANLMAAKFAVRIAVAFDSAIHYFPENVRNRVAKTGIPVRREIITLETEGARQYLGLDASVPTLLILGGSQGSARINETVLAALPELISFTNVIHQTGNALFKDAEARSSVILRDAPLGARYHVFPYLDAVALRQAAGAAALIVSRAGAGAIAEIATWKKPAVLIPIPEEVSHDQRTNAYTYAHAGAAVVIEEENLAPHVLTSEVRRILSDPELIKRMGEKGGAFADPGAARIIADEAIAIALSHEN